MDTQMEERSLSAAGRDGDDVWPGDGRAIPVAILPIHRAVAGRVRLRIAALRGSSATESLLDRGLASVPGVSSAKANRLTGNVLLHYEDDAISLDEILGFIAALLRGDIALPDDQDLAGQPAWHRQHSGEVATALETSPALGLEDEAARDRLRTAGYNVLPTLAGRSRLALLAEQFQSLPVALLAGAAVAASLVALSVGAAGLPGRKKHSATSGSATNGCWPW